MTRQSPSGLRLFDLSSDCPDITYRYVRLMPSHPTQARHLHVWKPATALAFPHKVMLFQLTILVGAQGLHEGRGGGFPDIPSVGVVRRRKLFAINCAFQCPFCGSFCRFLMRLLLVCITFLCSFCLVQVLCCGERDLYVRSAAVTVKVWRSRLPLFWGET